MHLLLFLACTGSTEKTAFPDVLTPIEEMKVEAPEGSSSEPYPETYEVLSADEGDYAWVHLRGYIQSDMSTVWDSIRNDLVYVNQREVASYEIEELDSDIYDFVFQVYNDVENIVMVEFTNEWRHVATEGTKDVPEEVTIRWQKIEGTEFIASIEGSIQIIPVADGRKDVVEVQVIEHLSATLDQESSALIFVEDLFERWALVSHGQEIPAYE